jgi:hypothetical protein
MAPNNFYWSCVLVALGCITACGEYLSRMELFSAGGVLSWRVIRTDLTETPWMSLVRKLDPLFEVRGLVMVLTARLIAALALLVPQRTGAYYCAALSLVFITGCILSFRCRFGNDGSDQMLNIVAAGLIPCAAFPGGRWPRDAGLWFIALQSCLAYATSGAAKAVSAVWRSGQALRMILNTASYGNRRLARRLQKNPPLSCALSWSVIAFECLFPLCLLAPHPVRLGFFAAGVVFHGTNASVMGLNTFLWAFVATYPVIESVSQSGKFW